MSKKKYYKSKYFDQSRLLYLDQLREEFLSTKVLGKTDHYSPDLKNSNRLKFISDLCQRSQASNDRQFG